MVRDQELRAALLELLATQGWHALAVPSVDDARARLAHVRPAVLMVDVGSAEADTLGLLAELSDRDEAPPTLVVSEGDAAASIALAYGVGHLGKPFGRYAFEAALDDAREAKRRPSQRHRLPPV
ncbi:MAG: hypothetical protein ABI175_05685 [Polyangiales bacterium]